MQQPKQQDYPLSTFCLVTLKGRFLPFFYLLRGKGMHPAVGSILMSKLSAFNLSVSF